MSSWPDVLDWGRGEYEHTASELWPVAEIVVGQAAPAPAERVLDLGCGTGNAALLAARAGSEVVAVDPAARLLAVAAARLREEGLHAEFLQASAERLPFPDGSFDVVLSVFAVIFADDAERAAAEIVRVLRPGGRAMVTSWAPEGALFEAIGGVAGAVAALEAGSTETDGGVRVLSRYFVFRTTT